MAKGEQTRQFIIERSAPIFNKKGIAATAMSDIMEATKLSKGSLYVHFENKEVLAFSAVEYNMEMLHNKVMSAVNKHRKAKDRLFAYLDMFVDPANMPVPGGCPMMNFGAEADDTNEVVRRKVNQVIDQSQRFIADIISKGILDQEFNPEWNYKEFSTIMFAMLEGGIMITRVSGNNSKMKIINRNLKEMITEKLI